MDKRKFTFTRKGMEMKKTLMAIGFAVAVAMGATAADGTCDQLVSTAALDLSRLSLKLGDANLNEDCVYTLATSANGFTGTFANMDVPKKWRVSVHETKITLAYSNGTVLLLR